MSALPQWAFGFTCSLIPSSDSPAVCALLWPAKWGGGGEIQWERLAGRAFQCGPVESLGGVGVTDQKVSEPASHCLSVCEGDNTSVQWIPGRETEATSPGVGLRDRVCTGPGVKA